MDLASAIRFLLAFSVLYALAEYITWKLGLMYWVCVMFSE